MGWLLINRKKKAKKSRTRKPAKKGWDPARVYRMVQWSLALLIVAGLAAGWIWGQERLRRSVTAAAPGGATRVELVDLPTWMPATVADELRQAVSRCITPDPFDRTSLRTAAQMLATSPWIKQVHRVSRRPGGVVEVTASYRQGAALVRTQSGCHLIDRDAVRLPFSYSAAEGPATGLPIILGAREPMPEAGRAWSGEDLQAGLRLAACIAGQSWSGQVAGIDVTNHAGRISDRRAHLKIVTALDDDTDPFNNPGIDWGRTPGDERFYEPAAAWKLRRISLEFGKHGRLEDRIVQVTTEPGLTQRIPGVPDNETFVNATPRQ